MINEEALWECIEERIRRDLGDCSTTDYYDISQEGVANLAGIATRSAREAMRLYLKGFYEMQHPK